jgi:hypothetical protein
MSCRDARIHAIGQAQSRGRAAHVCIRRAVNGGLVVGVLSSALSGYGSEQREMPVVAMTQVGVSARCRRASATAER